MNLVFNYVDWLCLLQALRILVNAGAGWLAVGMSGFLMGDSTFGWVLPSVGDEGGRVGGYAGGSLGGLFATLVNSIQWRLMRLAGGWPCVLSDVVLDRCRGGGPGCCGVTVGSCAWCPIVCLVSFMLVPLSLVFKGSVSSCIPCTCRLLAGLCLATSVQAKSETTTCNRV